jgi:hypothetical protein
MLIDGCESRASFNPQGPGKVETIIRFSPFHGRLYTENFTSLDEADQKLNLRSLGELFKFYGSIGMFGLAFVQATRGVVKSLKGEGLPLKESISAIALSWAARKLNDSSSNALQITDSQLDALEIMKQERINRILTQD